MKFVLEKKGLKEAARVQNVFCLLHSTWDNERRMGSSVSSVDRMLAQALSSRKEDDPEGLREEFEGWLSLVATQAGTDPFYMSIIKYVLGVLCKVRPLRDTTNLRHLSDDRSSIYHPDPVENCERLGVVFVVSTHETNGLFALLYVCRYLSAES